MHRACPFRSPNSHSQGQAQSPQSASNRAVWNRAVSSHPVAIGSLGKSLLLFVLLALNSLNACADENAKTTEQKDTFSELVKPFLAKNCYRCHSAKKQEADLRLDQLDPNIRTGTDIDRWNLIRFQLVSEQMPPKDSPQPNRGKSKQVISWLTTELKTAGAQLLVPDDHFLPSLANQVDHQLLFNGTIKTPPASRPRIWRKSPHIYDSLTKGELAKNVRGIAQPFSELTGNDLKDYSDAFSIDEPTADQLIRNSRLIVEHQTAGELKDGKWHRKGYPQPVKEFTNLFLPANQPLSRELKNKAINKQFQLILKRDATELELDRYVALMDKSIDSSDLQTGIRVALTAVLLTPEAVFRFEIGAGEPDQHGRVLLAPREIAYAISYSITDRGPDAQLLRAAVEGKLRTKADVLREIDRIFKSPKVAKPRIMRFFREYFGYHRAPEVFKDAKLNPHHRADALVKDTEYLIEWILEKDEDVFRQLLTSNKSFVNYSYDQKRKQAKTGQSKQLVHTSYGLPVDWKWTPQQPVELPANERAGILTQPSWLVSMSGNFDNHPILRGKWIREHLLGGTIPDLPITVDAQLPEEPENTLRHRMRVTREDYCWNCHQRMNPLGLSFETYDHFGRFRTLEKILDKVATEKNTDPKGKTKGEVYAHVPLDASGKITLTGDPEIESDFSDAIEMIHQLAETARARQMFVRYAFRYFLGRNETLDDSQTLIHADQDYLQSNGSFKALIKSLLTSDSFLYRIQSKTIESK